MNPPKVALAGSPNAGKTAIFNALTGSNQKIGNYPGVTVERKSGDITTRSGQLIRVIDLPGTYGMTPLSPDEKITVDILTNQKSDDHSPDIIVAICDSTKLERGLRFVLELKKLGKPMVVAINMMDIAEKRNLQLDLGILDCEKTWEARGEEKDSTYKPKVRVLGQRDGTAARRAIRPSAHKKHARLPQCPAQPGGGHRAAPAGVEADGVEYVAPAHRQLKKGGKPLCCYKTVTCTVQRGVNPPSRGCSGHFT